MSEEKASLDDLRERFQSYLGSDAKEVAKYSSDPIAFMEDIMGLTMKEFHKAWVNLFEKNSAVCLLAPRGHGKSWIVGSYILWKILKDPYIRILIVTINQDRASEMMHFVQYQLLNNQKIIDLFGKQRGTSNWSKEKIRVTRDGKNASMSPDPTLKVLGADSRMIGGHYDLIVMDDVCDEVSTSTEHRRQKTVSWFNNTLSPMLEPGGKIINIGTSWHPGDIHHYLIDRAGFAHKKYKAIIYEDKESGRNKVLWKDRWPYKKLVGLRKRIGTNSFAMQMQNEFLSAEDAPIQYEWIKYYDKQPSHLTKYMGVDLASESMTSDYFVICVIGIDSLGDIYVLDLVRTKASMYKQFELIKEKDRQWSPVKIGVESVASQKMIVDELMRTTTMPIVPIKSSTTSRRDDRVMRLSVLFESGRIFLSDDLTILVDELTAYPKGEHDDTVDGLSFAIQTSEKKKKLNWDEAVNMISTRKYEIKKI